MAWTRCARLERAERQRREIPGPVQPTLMAKTANEGIRLKEAFLPPPPRETSAIRISRLLTNSELCTRESAVRNNHAGGGEEAGGGGGAIIHLSDRGRHVGVKLPAAVTFKRAGVSAHSLVNTCSAVR